MMREEDWVLVELMKAKQWKVIADRINGRIRRDEYINRGERVALAHAKLKLKEKRELRNRE